jgi:hypothetical protein
VGDVVGDHHHERAHVELDPVEPVAGGLAHDRQLLVRRLGGRRRERALVDHTGGQRRVDPDDVGLPGGDPQHPRSTSADQDRGSGLLDRLGEPVVAGDRVVLAGERERLGSERAADDGEALEEPVDADAGRVVRDARLLVVADLPAGAETDLEPSVGQDVERRQLLGEHDRVLVVVVEHERTDAQRRRGVGGTLQGRHRGELVGEVVGHRQRAVAERFDLACQLHPLVPAADGGALDAEAERTWMRHGVPPYATASSVVSVELCGE